MKRIATIVLLFALPIAALAEEAPTAERLSWLAGHWSSEHDGRWTEEAWTDARGGMLLGVNRSGQGSEARAFEFLRIAVDEAGTLTYWASPGGGPATAFALTESSATHAVFENPAHDYPVRIEYRLREETLTATISGAEGANPMRWTFTRRR